MKIKNILFEYSRVKEPQFKPQALGNTGFFIDVDRGELDFTGTEISGTVYFNVFNRNKDINAIVGARVAAAVDASSDFDYVRNSSVDDLEIHSINVSGYDVDNTDSDVQVVTKQVGNDNIKNTIHDSLEDYLYNWVEANLDSYKSEL